MALSNSKSLPLLALLVSTATAAAPATTKGAPAPLVAGDEPVKLDAASSEVDYKTNTVVFKDVVITQGGMRVQAARAHATGLNFANSKWSFEGNVRIDAEPRGNLRSDTAVVEFKDNHISRATVVGKPADFEQKRAGSEQMARGHADEIVYDVNEGTVRLTDDAWLSDGQSTIAGPLLVYDIRGQRVQAAAAPGSGKRVTIEIQPRSAPASAKDAPKTTAPDASKPPTPQS